MKALLGVDLGTSAYKAVALTIDGQTLPSGMIVDPFLQPTGPWGAMFALTAVGTIVDRYLTTVLPLPKSLARSTRYQRFDRAAGQIRAGEEGIPIDPLLPCPENRAERARLCAGHSLAQLSRRCHPSLIGRRHARSRHAWVVRPIRLAIGKVP